MTTSSARSVGLLYTGDVEEGAWGMGLSTCTGECAMGRAAGQGRPKAVMCCQGYCAV